MDPNKPNEIKFKRDFTALSSAYSVSSNKDAEEFDNYEIAHFRLLTDTNFLPYGRSIIEPTRKVWKQITLMEDAMLIHRIMRAPDKRVFKIDIGNIPPNEVEAFMEGMVNKMKKVPYIDQDTGVLIITSSNINASLVNPTQNCKISVQVLLKKSGWKNTSLTVLPDQLSNLLEISSLYGSELLVLYKHPPDTTTDDITLTGSLGANQIFSLQVDTSGASDICYWWIYNVGDPVPTARTQNITIASGSVVIPGTNLYLTFVVGGIYENSAIYSSEPWVDPGTLPLLELYPHPTALVDPIILEGIL